MVRLVLDTNILVSALISPGRLPDRLLQHWEAGDFTLITSVEQREELERVLAYEKLQRFIRPDQTERLLANLHRMASFATDLPHVTASADVSDNVILATAVAGQASHLVTGDKGHLLVLKQYESVAIITVREAIALLSSLTASG